MEYLLKKNVKKIIFHRFLILLNTTQQLGIRYAILNKNNKCIFPMRLSHNSTIHIFSNKKSASIYLFIIVHSYFFVLSISNYYVLYNYFYIFFNC